MIYCNSDFDAYITDKYFDYLSELSPVKRMAEKFRLQLEEIPIYLFPNECIVGWFGFDKKINTENFRKFSVKVTDEERKILEFPPTINCQTVFDRAHVCVDYNEILCNGLVLYEKKIFDELKKDKDNEYLNAMYACIQSVRNFSDRIAEFIDEKQKNADGCEKERLIRLKNTVQKVPYYPSESFVEALQAIWIIHFLIPLAENAWYSISLGRFDKYMYSYYKKEMESGVTRQEIKNMLLDFYKLLNSYSDAACLLNIGSDYNELSELLIECQKDFNMPSPILGARISEDTPDRIFEKLIDEKLFSAGQPTFYSEENCIKAITEKGVPMEEAIGFTNNSCMAIGVAGKEVNSMWGCVFNVSASLEMALNNGMLLKNSDEISCTAINTTQELFDEFKKYCIINMDKCLNSYELNAEMAQKNNPDAFISILTDGCINKHCDRINGAKYHNVTVECMGMVNASDALYAIDKLVLKEKRYTLDELSKAVKNNFCGCKNVRNDILGCSKYGTNSDADEFAVRVANILADIIKSHNHDNFFFMPSLHTLAANIDYGKDWGAGYDGRLAETPFAKNAGPCNNVRSNAPTSVALSAAKLPQYRFYGGQPVDIHFDAAHIKEKKGLVAAFIKTYFERGGLQLQVNSASSEVLRDAVENPDAHKDLIVRIGGFSDYFNKFSPATKLEFIERFEREENS